MSSARGGGVCAPVRALDQPPQRAVLHGTAAQADPAPQQERARLDIAFSA